MPNGADIIDLDAKRREFAVEPKNRRMAFWLDKDGCLQIAQKNSRGVTVVTWMVPPEESEKTITALFRQLSQWKTKSFYEKYPNQRPAVAPPVKPPDPRKSRCRLTPNGLIGPSGCRRQTGHEGDHRIGALSWTAAYPHHRYCSTLITTPAQAVRAYGPKARIVQVSGPSEPRRLDSKRPIVVVDGRCTQCFFRVGPVAV